MVLNRSVLFCCVFFLALPFLLEGQLPKDFYDEVFADGYRSPTSIQFDQNGQLYIGTKGGRIYVIDTSGAKIEKALVDINEEVTWWGDNGLMDFALDPNFLENGYIYLLYSVDLHYLEEFGKSGYDPNKTIVEEPSIGRVTRYQADPATQFTTLIPGSRKILLGEDIHNGIPIFYAFHGLGSILAANDGTLLISTGDGTGNKIADIGGDGAGAMASKALEMGIISPDMDLGSYKAQYPGALSGKILRIDAQTGDGLPSNPYYDADQPRSPQSRVWTMGMRNPYRISLKPETGSHYAAEGNPGTIYVGDVGNGSWEELNIVKKGGENLGWPITEGVGLNWAFWTTDVPENQLAPNPLAQQGGCNTPYFNFRELFIRKNAIAEKIPANPCNNLEEIPAQFYSRETTPIIAWSNFNWNPPARAILPAVSPDSGGPTPIEVTEPGSWVKSEAFNGFSSLAGVFYTKGNYPEEYHNTYFAVDFSGWIKTFIFDEQDELQEVKSFHDAATEIIHLTSEPRTGDLFYTNLQGEVRRITYGGNPRPVAIIETDQSYGPGPLRVQFDASNSFDLNLPLVAYHWDFGDGTTSTALRPQHTFQAIGGGPKSYTVQLTVTDSLGAFSSTEEIISLNNTPPQVKITSFNDGDLYPIDATSVLQLEAEVLDAEHEDASLLYEWRVFLHHNNHFHPEPATYDAKSFALISPLGCQEESYWYRIELAVTDPEGLQTRVTQKIYPYCEADFVNITTLEANATDQQVELNWEGIEENSLNSYIIQRSEDLFHFETIGQIDPQGSGSNYEFIDPSPVLGENIYRLKMISAADAFRYSNIAEVIFPEEVAYERPAIQISPNPAANHIMLWVEKVEEDYVALELFDMNGRRILLTGWQSASGQAFSKRILVNNLSNGLYLYRIKSGEQKLNGQLLISK